MGGVISTLFVRLVPETVKVCGGVEGPEPSVYVNPVNVVGVTVTVGADALLNVTAMLSKPSPCPLLDPPIPSNVHLK